MTETFEISPPDSQSNWQRVRPSAVKMNGRVPKIVIALYLTRKTEPIELKDFCLIQRKQRRNGRNGSGEATTASTHVMSGAVLNFSDYVA
jgi:hypothetical protein